MTIDKSVRGTELQLRLQGRLDTTTAPELEAALKASLDGITKLTLDMTGLEYLSSAGLRVLLYAQKAMSKQGEMIVANVGKAVLEVFEITGFADILTIK